MESKKSFESVYKNSRNNLLFMTLFTLINIVLLIINAEVSFPFSAIFPQVIYIISASVAVDLGVKMFAIVGIVTIAGILGLFVLCFFMSKKHYGWMIAASILFLLDTLFLIFLLFDTGFDTSYIIDILFHAWVMYYLIVGIISGYKMKNAKPEDTDLLDVKISEVADMATEADNNIIENVSYSEAEEDIK